MQSVMLADIKQWEVFEWNALVYTRVASIGHDFVLCVWNTKFKTNMRYISKKTYVYRIGNRPIVYNKNINP